MLFAAVFFTAAFDQFLVSYRTGEAYLYASFAYYCIFATLAYKSASADAAENNLSPLVRGTKVVMIFAWPLGAAIYLFRTRPWLRALGFLVIFVLGLIAADVLGTVLGTTLFPRSSIHVITHS
jgi:hypothetical protein